MCVHLYVCLYVFVCESVCVSVCMYVSVCMCVFVCVRVCVREYTFNVIYFALEIQLDLLLCNSNVVRYSECYSPYIIYVL